MGLLDDAKSGVSKWFEEQVAKNKAFKAAGGMGKSNPAMTRSMGLLPTTGLLEQEGDAAARADAAYGALRKEYGPLGLRPGDFVPFASGGLAIDDARLAAAKGNYGQAAGSLAGVIPVAGAVGKVVRKITGGKSSGVIDSVKREISDGPALSVGKADSLGIQGGTGSGTNTQNINRFETEADRRMAAAQRNAALPFEQGGLGLPANNTAMDRAKALGHKPVDGEDFYGGNHRPPMSDNGAPANDLTGGGNIYPDDVYSSNAARYYGSGEASDNALFRKLQALKGKPDEKVRVFRAVPSEVMEQQGNMMHHGDWVTPNRQYAVDHGEGALNGDYRIQASDYPAKTLFTNGDSPYEFGIDKSQLFADGPASIPLMISNQHSVADRSRFAAFDPMRRNESDLLALNGQKTGSGLLNPEITKATNRGLYRIMLDDEEENPSFPYGLIGK